MESSVESYINAQPEQAMSWSDYYSQYTGYDSALADHPFGKLENFFTGNRDKAWNSYQAYLSNLNNRNEFLAQQSARAYDKMMDDSKVQRAMKDYEAAGLNPYLLLNNGSISAGTAPTSSKASYGTPGSKDKKSANGRDLALILLAVARVAAALI